MKIGILVNVLSDQQSESTTFQLAAEAVSQGHEVFVTVPGSLSLDSSGHVSAVGKKVLPRKMDAKRFLSKLLDKNTIDEKILLDELDIFWLRTNPAVQKRWSQFAGLQFGRICKLNGVLVLNDPDGLSRAMNKIYLETFPEVVRPKTIVTRNPTEIKAFLQEYQQIILKPLQGYGGSKVFLAQNQKLHNLNQMIETIIESGFIVAQEYVPAAEEGDTRLYFVDGKILKDKTKAAIVTRARGSDDLRSNVHVGGKPTRAVFKDYMWEIEKSIGPRFFEDGLFFVGVDLAGNKILEMNVFCPGGLGTAQSFEKANFIRVLLKKMEEKLEATSSKKTSGWLDPENLKNQPRQLSSLKQ